MKKIMFIFLVSIISIGLFCGYGFAQSGSSASSDAEASTGPQLNNQHNFSPQINQQSVDQTFEASEQKRNLPNVNMAPFPNAPTYFAKPKETFESMPIPDIVRIKSKWDLIDIKSWVYGKDGNVDLHSHDVYTRDWPEDQLKELRITFVKPDDFTFMGVVVAKADKNVPMETVFGKILEKAMNMGGNLVYPMNQGASRVLSANAWGASLGYTHVAISEGSQSNAGGGSVGVGYTHGEVRYNHEPFLRVMVGRVNQDTFNNLKVFPENGHSKVKQQLKKQNEMLRNKLRQLQQQVQEDMN